MLLKETLKGEVITQKAIHVGFKVLSLKFNKETQSCLLIHRITLETIYILNYYLSINRKYVKISSNI